jgi:hypothetical protein
VTGMQVVSRAGVGLLNESTPLRLEVQAASTAVMSSVNQATDPRVVKVRAFAVASCRFPRFLSPCNGCGGVGAVPLRPLEK